jgi:hypothetical protein
MCSLKILNTLLFFFKLIFKTVIRISESAIKRGKRRRKEKGDKRGGVFSKMEYQYKDMYRLRITYRILY